MHSVDAIPDGDSGKINKQIFKSRVLPEVMRDEVADIHELTKVGIREFVNSQWREENEAQLGGKQGVGRLQTALQQKGFYSGIIDNTFGPGTLVAVLNFQIKNGLNPDGVAGPLTQEKLGLTSPAGGVLDQFTNRYQDRFDEGIAPHTLANLRSYFGLGWDKSPLDAQLIEEIKNFQTRYNDGKYGLFGRKPDVPLRTDGYPDEKTTKIILTFNVVRSMRF